MKWVKRCFQKEILGSHKFNLDPGLVPLVPIVPLMHNTITSSSAYDTATDNYGMNNTSTSIVKYNILILVTCYCWIPPCIVFRFLKLSQLYFLL